MLLPEFCEELFYTSNLNLFETNFKVYLKKVNEYSFLETQSFLKRLNKYYTIDELKELEQLDLHNCGLTELPSLNLPNLEFLDLYNNKLKKLPNLNLHNLQELYLNTNQLTELPNLNLPNLKELYLSQNQLESISFISHNLQYLNLANNKLTKENLKYIKSLNIDRLIF